MDNPKNPGKISEFSRCPKCGCEFLCSPSGKCWCYEIFISPNKLNKINEMYDRCLCPTCLSEIVNTPQDIQEA
jgi:hypothetical protein